MLIDSSAVDIAHIARPAHAEHQDDVALGKGGHRAEIQRRSSVNGDMIRLPLQALAGRIFQTLRTGSIEGCKRGLPHYPVCRKTSANMGGVMYASRSCGLV